MRNPHRYFSPEQKAPALFEQRNRGLKSQTFARMIAAPVVGGILAPFLFPARPSIWRAADQYR